MSSAMKVLTVAVALLFSAVSGAWAVEEGKQSPLKHYTSARHKYPRIVLYSVSWCPHCKAAKEYLTKNDIPFINRDVEVDDAAMEDLTKKYKSQGVPLFVIGNDQVILKGFDQQKLQKAIKDVQKK